MPQRAIIGMVIGLLLLFGLYQAMQPDTTITPAAPDQPAQAFHLSIHNGELQSGPSRMQVSVGDRVIITAIANQADELHLHGYDLKLALQPNTAAELAFLADRSGRFEIELHRAHQTVAALEVYPAQR